MAQIVIVHQFHNANHNRRIWADPASPQVRRTFPSVSASFSAHFTVLVQTFQIAHLIAHECAWPCAIAHEVLPDAQLRMAHARLRMASLKNSQKIIFSIET